MEQRRRRRNLEGAIALRDRACTISPQRAARFLIIMEPGFGLCPHPQKAWYKGEGDTNDAANYTCAVEQK
jgi:hypothetical protein